MKTSKVIAKRILAQRGKKQLARKVRAEDYSALGKWVNEWYAAKRQADAFKEADDMPNYKKAFQAAAKLARKIKSSTAGEMLLDALQKV